MRARILLALVATSGIARSAAAEDVVTVNGARSDVRTHRDSAEAVSVYDTTRTRRESADLGEVLARAPGISLARTGGLGAEARFSLDGFSNDQVRVFLDGLPIELAGFAFGIASVPVNLVDRIEIYRGVVPIRFGADALGGAVDLVTPARYYESGASASYQVGSFATYRATGSGRIRHGHLFAAASGFLDSTRNDYRIKALAPDSTGRLHVVTVPRFHDRYAARGGSVEMGLLDEPWADRLVLRAFVSSYGKDLQNNTIGTVPYGAVTYDESLAGATLRYQKNRIGRIDVDALASVSRRNTDFLDVSRAAYDWFGRVTAVRPGGGEITGAPRDTTVSQDAFFGRAVAAIHVSSDHTIRATISPSWTESSGVSRTGLLPGRADPLARNRDLLKVVGGIEHESHWRRDRVENSAFLKGYGYHAAASLLLTDSVAAPLDAGRGLAGFGDGLRVRVGGPVVAKASYEYAARLPGAAELFGNGLLVAPNGALRPERSHNANLGLQLDARTRRAGAFGLEASGFVRDATNLFALLGNQYGFTYRNVLSARTLGAEGLGAWTSPGGIATLEGSLTYQDIRNTSEDGAYSDYRGDRIPNTPFFFGSARVRLQRSRLLVPSDEVSATWTTRGIDAFYRSWESIGDRDYKIRIDAQLVHSLTVAYVVHGPVTVSSAFDLSNLTNAQVFDVYGVQRPGRALFVKTTIEL